MKKENKKLDVSDFMKLDAKNIDSLINNKENPNTNFQNDNSIFKPSSKMDNKDYNTSHNSNYNDNNNRFLNRQLNNNNRGNNYGKLDDNRTENEQSKLFILYRILQ